MNNQHDNARFGGDRTYGSPAAPGGITAPPGGLTLTTPSTYFNPFMPQQQVGPSLSRQIATPESGQYHLMYNQYPNPPSQPRSHTPSTNASPITPDSGQIAVQVAESTDSPFDGELATAVSGSSSRVFVCDPGKRTVASATPLFSMASQSGIEMGSTSHAVQPPLSDDSLNPRINMDYVHLLRDMTVETHAKLYAPLGLLGEKLVQDAIPIVSNLRCGLCGGEGHDLARCTIINADGFTFGCPRCNLLSHSFDMCPKKPVEELANLRESLQYLFEYRLGRPPIESVIKWEDVALWWHGKAGEYPQTAAFAAHRAQRLGRQNVPDNVFGLDNPVKITLRCTKGPPPFWSLIGSKLNGP